MAKHNQRNEEYGAGFDGTDELLSNYLDQTPHARITRWPNSLMTFDEWANSSTFLDEGVRMGKSDVRKIKGSYTIGFEFEVATGDIDIGSKSEEDLFAAFYQNWPEERSNFDAPDKEEYFDSELSDEEQYEVLFEAILKDNAKPKGGWESDETEEMIKNSNSRTLYKFMEEYSLTMNEIGDFEFFTPRGNVTLALMTIIDSYSMIKDNFYINLDDYDWWVRWEERDRDLAIEAFDTALMDGLIEDSEMSAINYVEDFVISNFPYEDMDVIKEETRGVDAEIVTPPYELEKGLKMLKQVNEAIDEDDVLQTNYDTGLHATIGKWSDNEINSVDWLKFLVIYGTENTLKRFGRAANRFAISRIQAIVTALGGNIDSYKDAIESVNQIVFEFSPKLSAFNFSKLINEGLLEFRGFGNEGYEKKSDEIIFEIRKILYAIEVASDETAYREEYLKGLYKISSKNSSENNDLEILYRGFVAPAKINAYGEIPSADKLLTVISDLPSNVNIIKRFFDKFNADYVKILRNKISEDIMSGVSDNSLRRLYGDNVAEAICYKLANDGFDIPKMLRNRSTSPDKIESTLYTYRSLARATLNTKGLKKLFKYYPLSSSITDLIERPINDAR